MTNETGVPGRLAFPGVPDTLRDTPTLVISLLNPSAGMQNLELSYLTSGLAWRADYVAELNADDDRLDLNGWVTLTNQSGAAYPNAKLQLVAGDLNRVREAQPMSRATMANVRTNVALALGSKAIFLVTTVLGITGMWIAVLADTGATVLVTLNALRLLRVRLDDGSGR